MPAYVCEAVEVITDDGTGIPVTYSNTGIGLATDGHFYLITDRPAISSVTGDTTRTAWYTGILTRDFGGFSISRHADFVEAGCMEQVSGLSFGIKNTGAFWSTLRTNGVYLGRRRVKYYRVTSTDGAAWNFELRWTGVIDDQPFNETTYSVQCVDVSKDIFGSLPVQAVNSSTFEDAPADSRDKMIPIALGRVAYSPLVNIKQVKDPVTLAIVDSIEYKFAACTYAARGSTLVTLKTNGVAFVYQDTRLTGKFLSQIDGGEEQTPRILFCHATDTSDPAAYYTDVILDEPISGTPVVWTSTPGASHPWFFEVLDLAPILVASTKAIYQSSETSQGRAAVSTYGTDEKTFLDQSEINPTVSEENIAASGYPGYTIVTKSATQSGEMIAPFNITPENVKVVTNTGFSGDLPAAGAEAPLLFDRNDATLYTLVGSGSSVSLLIALDVYIPRDAGLKEFEQLSPLFDFSHMASVGGTNALIEATITVFDLYGRELSTNATTETLWNGAVPTTDTPRNLLPRSYFGLPGDAITDANYYLFKSALDIADDINNSKVASIYKRFRLTLEITTTGGVGTYTITLGEIGIVGRKSINVSTESVYAGLIGETYGTTWDARKTAADPIQTPVDALEHLVRNYDESAPVWLAATAYVVGDKVRGTADTGHIFVCSTAGTSHASTEPTWTDTAGATYSDGTVTWTELRAIAIDTDSFDVTGAARGLWLVGRTLTEKKPSLDYYKELLAQCFLVGNITPSGKLRIRPWLDDTAPLVTFDSSNILEGTLKNITPTPMSRVRNDLLVRYDKNPGSGKFNKQIAVTKIDKPVFPGPNDSVAITGSPPVVLGGFTAVYGLVGTDYTFYFETDDPHGLVTGDFVTLAGSFDGFDFGPRAVTVVDTENFTVAGHAPSNTITTTGTLSQVFTYRLKWKEYVIGIDSYGIAKLLWDQCHESYCITKRIEKTPDSLSNCEWFFDPYALDANGGFAWSSDGGATCNLDVGDEHSAYFFVSRLAAWTAWQKDQTSFETIDNATYSARQIGDCVSFNDAKLTGGVAVTGWIHEKTQLPRTGTLPERFRFGITMLPSGYVAGPSIIDENDATDIIDENSATDIIDENEA